MPFPPINLHSRISSPGKELFGKKKPGGGLGPPQPLLSHKPKAEPEEAPREKPGRKHLHQPQHHHHQAAQLSADGAAPLLDTDRKGSWVAVAKPLGSSCESVPRSSSGESAAARGGRHSSREEAAEQEVRFSLSLTPEAVVVIQKRNLEKQMLAKQQKCCGSADLRHRRVLPSKRAQGGSKGPAAAAAGGAARPDGPGDISAIVKISLLNDQHKYDDVEYEEEDGDVDETVMRKCKEWLKGVESAAAFGRVDKLSALPHLSSR